MEILYILAFIIITFLFIKKILEKFNEKPMFTLGLLIALPLFPYLAYLITKNEIIAGIVLGILGFIFIVYIFDLY